MFDGMRVALIIPVLNEEETIGLVVRAVDRSLIDEVIVVDNGSMDRSADRAMAAGARVLHAAHRGYGSACQVGIRALEKTDLIAFMDGDGSDMPQELPMLFEALRQHRADLVIGSRTLGQPEPGALSPLQRLGNTMTCGLVSYFWGVTFSDLGPLRVVRRAALEKMKMSDPDFGWTIEMQVKAAQMGLRIHEVPVTYRRRQGGQSKVSGTVIGSYRAGKRILGYVLVAKAREFLEPILRT